MAEDYGKLTDDQLRARMAETSERLSELRFTGPRIGDRVQVEARGTVREMQGRGGVPGVLVDLDDGAQVWVPIDDVVLLNQPAADAAP